jgi:hypothetical protein
MIDLFKKPKKLSWWTSLKLLWAVMFAKLYYWWTGKIRIQFQKVPEEAYGPVRRSGHSELVRIVKLPAKFKTLFILHSDDRVVIECETMSSDDGDLEWVSTDLVRLRESDGFKLMRAPSLILKQNPDQEPVEIQDKLFFPVAEERLKFTAYKP